jgi:adenine-specific DNA methylase
MQTWVKDNLRLLSKESLERFIKFQKNPKNLDDNKELRSALLDFIADFANWDNSNVKEFLNTSRALTQAAHEALGGAPGTKPLVVDPFAGGGSIPLEALRVGADAFASDLNPVAVLLNKVVLEYIPKYGQRLADEVRKWGEWIKREAEKELAEFYPKDADGATTIAYLWARTVQCEGPGCGVEVPLIRSLWLAKKANRSVALQLVPNPKAKRVDFQIIVKQRGGWVNQDDHNEKFADPKLDGTVKRGSATCPCCGYTTPVARVREQFKARSGGAHDAKLFCVVTTHDHAQGRFYRAPTAKDIAVAKKAASELERRSKIHNGPLPLIPNEHLPLMSGVFNVPIYGHNTWGSLFTPRQALTLTTLARLVSACGEKLRGTNDEPFSKAVKTCLALVMDRQANTLTSLSRWHLTGEKIEGVFARQALGMVWDFVEANSFSGATGDLDGALEWVEKVCAAVAAGSLQQGHVERASATQHPLPDDSANAFVTDPPYYNAVPYADLSDFFYVWLRRTIGNDYPELFSNELSPKDDEACEMAGWDPVRYAHKNSQWFEKQMKKAMTEGRRVLSPDGIGIVVFAHKSTAGWEAQLQAMIDAGWVTTGSWPIDTEMGARLRAQDSAVLASSVHLVCRPRENPDGSLRTDQVGDWRDVLQELPRRIHEWMPRLAEEGVVGADAIFACIGPALEVFSRYSRVEKASGEVVTLREYLEQVWAAVAKEALNVIFEGADATGFEEDARLTAMWLWTLSAGANGNGTANESDDEVEEEGENSGKVAKPSGFLLEYDAARKIAQGLGAHLDKLSHLVEIKGETARLLSVSERTRYLLGKDDGSVPTAKRKQKAVQLTFEALLKEVEKEEGGWADKDLPKAGTTVLDRIHQSMVLFAAGRNEALKRFLVTEGVGQDQRFWRLAQALSALYPKSTDERRWVEGLMAKKKALGF